MLPSDRADELDLRAEQVHGRGQDVEVRDGGLENGGAQGLAPDQDVVDVGVERALVDAEPAGGVSLGVEVDEERPALGHRETGGQVDRGRRLADAPLLVDDSDHAGPAFGGGPGCGGGIGPGAWALPLLFPAPDRLGGLRCFT